MEKPWHGAPPQTTSRALGRKDEAWLTQVVVYQRVIHYHFAVFSPLFLEREVLRRGTKRLISQLGFEKASDIPIADFLKVYKKYYRFYPSLLSADI